MPSPPFQRHARSRFRRPPTVSADFAKALRSFCAEVVAGAREADAPGQTVG